MNNFELKLNELIELINSQEEVIRYKQIEEELKQNDYIKGKIADFKKLQQKMVIYEHNKNNLPLEVEEEYNRLFTELTDIPIFNEYLDLQKEINETLQQVTQIIEREINKN